MRRPASSSSRPAPPRPHFTTPSTVFPPSCAPASPINASLHHRPPPSHLPSTFQCRCWSSARPTPSIDGSPIATSFLYARRSGSRPPRSTINSTGAARPLPPHGSAPSHAWWPDGRADEVLHVRDGKERLPRPPLPTIMGGSVDPVTSSVVGLAGPWPPLPSISSPRWEHRASPPPAGSMRFGRNHRHRPPKVDPAAPSNSPSYCQAPIMGDLLTARLPPPTSLPSQSEVAAGLPALTAFSVQLYPRGRATQPTGACS